MLVKTFSKVVKSQEPKAFESFIREVNGFYERVTSIGKPQFNQSSTVVEGVMMTHHTAIVYYKKNS
ncbi:hypothetical protein KKH36_00895 [Patescibacteria group bacterium]|nr:hypothetical protein [Patescibacteria group bacterium]